jgi:hypothetical protein
MSKTGQKALTARPSYEVEQQGRGPGEVLSRIVSEALVFARRSDVRDTTGCGRIGNYEFGEDSFKQITVWAKAINITTTELVETLSTVGSAFWDGTSFLVDNGSIMQVAFPKKLLSMKLDLSYVPLLRKLNCDNNNLKTLDLSKVPILKELYCQGNELSTLDVSKVPTLEVLACGGNQIDTLDLSSLLKLEGLLCGWNQLTELEIPSSVFKLHCTNNKIAKLDLRSARRLRFLDCDPSVTLLCEEYHSFLRG